MMERGVALGQAYTFLFSNISGIEVSSESEEAAASNSLVVGAFLPCGGTTDVKELKEFSPLIERYQLIWTSNERKLEG